MRASLPKLPVGARIRDSRRPWHYTNKTMLFRMFSLGAIPPTDAGIVLGELPAVWFSIRQDWEPSATPGLGPARIGVAPIAAPILWADFPRKARLPQQVAKVLAASAKDMGANPRDWRCSLEAVPRSKWRAVEIWYRGRWTPFPF